MDGNSQIIPIAIGVSQGETDDIQFVLPHVMDKKQPGRPKKKDHIRSQGEGQIITKCERCGAKGHNQTACNIPLPKIQNMVRKKLKSTQQESFTLRNIFRNGSHEEANHDVYQQGMYEPQHVTNNMEDMYHPHQDYTNQSFMYWQHLESINLPINGLS
ncbi:hypothetical protein Tco_0858040 [Tanacetum coccineum]|uniref:CCHC-type domain-containing protein n=1 Tax=Tanacetum coccineum TaxID=301880 RepID=A0ABQ5BBX5_9ASTR